MLVWTTGIIITGSRFFWFVVETVLIILNRNEFLVQKHLFSKPTSELDKILKNMSSRLKLNIYLCHMTETKNDNRKEASIPFFFLFFFFSHHRPLCWDDTTHCITVNPLFFLKNKISSGCVRQIWPFDRPNKLQIIELPLLYWQFDNVHGWS